MIPELDDSISEASVDDGPSDALSILPEDGTNG